MVGMMMSDSQVDLMAGLIAEKVLSQIEGKLTQQWLTREEYCQRSSLSLRTVDRLLKDGKLKHKRVGRRVMIANET